MNDRKETDKHPDRTGSCVIEGREYWVNGWLKEGKKGPFLSLAFKPKEAKEAPRKQQTSSRDDIPF